MYKSVWSFIYSGWTHLKPLAEVEVSLSVELVLSDYSTRLTSSVPSRGQYVGLQ